MKDPWSIVREHVYYYDPGDGFYLRLYAPGAQYPGLLEPCTRWTFTCEGISIPRPDYVIDAVDLEDAKTKVLTRVREVLKKMLASLLKETP